MELKRKAWLGLDKYECRMFCDSRRFYLLYPSTTVQQWFSMVAESSLEPYEDSLCVAVTCTRSQSFLIRNKKLQNLLPSKFRRKKKKKERKIGRKRKSQMMKNLHGLASSWLSHHENASSLFIIIALRQFRTGNFGIFTRLFFLPCTGHSHEEWRSFCLDSTLAIVKMT